MSNDSNDQIVATYPATKLDGKITAAAPPLMNASGQINDPAAVLAAANRGGYAMKPHLHRIDPTALSHINPAAIADLLTPGSRPYGSASNRRAIAEVVIANRTAFGDNSVLELAEAELALGT